MRRMSATITWPAIASELRSPTRAAFDRPLLHILHRLRPAAESLAREFGFHELVEIAVEDGAGIGGLGAGAQILHHLVGLQHIRADLVAPADIALGRVLG